MIKNLIASMLIFVASNVYAAPVVTSVGSVAHGQSTTIAGSGFGTKSTPAPQLWDTVSNQYGSLADGDTIPTGGSNPWATNGKNGNYGVVKYNTTIAEQRGKSAANYRSESAIDGVLQDHPITAGPQFYFSYWFWVESDPSNGGASNNNKFLRAGGTSGYTYSWNVNADYIYTDAQGYCNNPLYQNYFSNYSYPNNYGGGVVPGAWNLLELWVNSTAQTYESIINGHSNDGVQYWDNCTAFNFSAVQLIGFDAQGGARISMWDDVYADNTLSRIMICSGSVWTSRGTCEIQIPSAWSDTSATVTVNQGAFADSSSQYLYVVDSTGTANSSGYAVTFGAGGSDTTAPVVGTFTMPATASSLTVNVSSFTATDAVGVTGYCITTTNSSSGCSWSGSAPTTATASAAGAVTWYAWARDAAGNVSNTSTQSTTITLPSSTVRCGGSFSVHN
jgi:hypothetical protein